MGSRRFLSQTLLSDGCRLYQAGKASRKDTCLSWGFCSCNRTSRPETRWEGKGAFVLRLVAHRPGKSEQGPGGRSCCRGHGRGEAYWPAAHALLGLPSYTAQDHLPLGSTATHNGRGPPISIQSLENTLRLAHRQILWENFPDREPLFSSDPSLCQADRNQPA